MFLTVLLRCCVERDVPRQRDCFQATQEGIVVFRSPPDQILKSCLFEVKLVQFMVRGNNVSVDVFFFDQHISSSSPVIHLVLTCSMESVQCWHASNVFPLNMKCQLSVWMKK